MAAVMRPDDDYEYTRQAGRNHSSVTQPSEALFTLLMYL
jgi:hypothetical protein